MTDRSGRHVTFLRLLDSEHKDKVLLQLTEAGLDARRFDIGLRDLSSIPTSPFAYWLSNETRSAFSSQSAFSDHGWDSKQGLVTGDNFRLVRVWWEVRAGDTDGWFPFANGGKSSRFYSDVPQLVDYRPAAQEAIRQRGRYGRGAEFYLRPGITWPLRASAFCPQALPAGCLFSQRGQASFPRAGNDPLAYLALLGSAMFDYLYKVRVGRGGFPEFLVGVLKDLPLPVLTPSDSGTLSDLASKAWSARRFADLSIETSHAFVLPGVLLSRDADFVRSADGWANRLEVHEVDLEALQGEIDVLASRLYQVPMNTLNSGDTDLHSELEDGAQGLDGDLDDESIDVGGAGLAADLVSWCVGAGVGRFDVRLATGERDRPMEPGPFDPLPVCSPGMLTGEDGLPLEVPPEGYPVDVSPVMVDDPGHRLDITARVRSVFDVVFDDPDAWWTDVGEALGAKRGEVGSWLSKGFFDHHLKTCSKSRRKAPILWPLGTASGSYVVWLYAHRVTSDSLFRVLNDVVSPKLGVERRGLSELVQEAGPNPSAGERKAIDAQEKLVGELEELVEHLNGVTPLWHPDLNDGVVIVLAPLWRLFAHHKTWSKELRKHWNSLVAGDYDWAQLAMHLWPERVVPKCADDRSLAIAHGLEEMFWVQDDDNNPDKWRPRQTPNVPIEDLIAERTDPASKAALEDAT